MNNLIVEKISDSPDKRNDSTRSRVISGLDSWRYPAIHIENLSSELNVSDGILTVGDNSIVLLGKTILEVILWLRELGEDAYITSSSISLYPASLIEDAFSTITKFVKVTSSPFNLNDIFFENHLNCTDITDSSIYSKNPLSLVNSSGESVEFEISQGSVTFQYSESDLQALLEINVSSPILYIKKENLISPIKIIKSGQIDDNCHDVITNMNYDNKDLVDAIS